MFGKRGVMETTDDREGRACGWSAAWEGFRACGREVLLPVVAKVPKSTIQGEGDFVFPLPLKNPHPLKRPMREPRPPPLEPPPGERGPKADVHRKCTVGRGDHTPPPVMRQDIRGGMWGAIRALPVADEAR